jgi:sugar-specific transcriptional regulator TrmB/DNA-binding CsgD family transcriptional regulator
MSTPHSLPPHRHLLEVSGLAGFGMAGSCHQGGPNLKRTGKAACAVLEAFGIDQQVEDVYRALLDHPSADVAELATISGMPVDHVRRALDELARLSLVRPSWEDPGKIRPVRPDIGLEYLVAREHAELLRRQHQIEISRGAVTSLIAELSLQHQPEAADLTVATITGLDAIRIKLEQLAYGAEWEVLSLMPDGPQTEDNIEASRPLDEMLLRRGARVLSVYLESVRNDPLNRRYVKWLLEQGGEVRVTTVLPLRMLIFDRRIAVVPVNPARTAIGVTVIQGNGPVAAMCALFDVVWSTAAPYGDARAPHDNVLLTDQQQAAVRLLAEGDTDAALCRKLGISPRTVGRLVSEVMAQLGAKSRFQAGIRAAELGWHRHPPGSCD